MPTAVKPSPASAGNQRIPRRFPVAAKLRKVTLDPAEGNCCSFTLTVNNGQWEKRLTGGDPGFAPGNVVLSGTYVGTGDEINFYRHDHDYTGSDTEVWGPTSGARTAGRSRSRQTAGLAVPGDSGLVVEPWQQTGT